MLTSHPVMLNKTQSMYLWIAN